MYNNKKLKRTISHRFFFNFKHNKNQKLHMEIHIDFQPGDASMGYLVLKV